jgi:hypothetical protein
VRGFLRALSRALPEASVSVDAAEKVGADWFLDVDLNHHRVTVQWRAGKSFGISSESGPGLGEGPHEVIDGVAAAVAKVVDLLLHRRRTTVPKPLPLRQLRQQRGVSQAALARVLRVQQCSVSKQESRGDFLVSSLRSVIEAMGGRLRIVASFPDGVAREIAFAKKGAKE